MTQKSDSKTNLKIWIIAIWIETVSEETVGSVG